MSMPSFIFTTDPKKRLTRHVLFWICWFVYMATTQLRNQSPDVIGMKNFLVYQVAVSLNRLWLQILFCYTIIYFLVPFFWQKGKKFLFLVLLAAFLGIIYWLTFLDYTYLWFRTYEFISRSLPFYFDATAVKPLTPFLNRYYIIYSHVHFTGSVVACGLILAVKYYKVWFDKQRENALLQKENAVAELQLLKAQVHPHFLFNTLNNIYSLTLSDPTRASVMIAKLTGMVRYMVNEGAASLVPVEQEIQMLLDYIGLERIRYGDRLEMTMDISGAAASYRTVAPLLMIPFMENCFKHGASQMIGQTRIEMQVKTAPEFLIFSVSNNCLSETGRTDDGRKRIGIANVRKRLELIYPGRHLLDIRAIGNSFSVYLKIHFQP